MRSEELSLAVGFFDGVHRGHQAVLAGADEALTFTEHPLSTLATLGRTQAKPPELVMSREDRLAAIRDCGVRKVTALDFTPELAEMSAGDFAARYLAGRRIRCGANWRFGRGGEGSAEWLKAHGYEVEVISYADAAGEPISSTRVRRAISRGFLSSAREMLGRDWSIVGKVFAGKGMGRRIGYPTVNLDFSESGVGVRPPLGVYIVEIDGVKALANWGIAPTAGDKAWTEPVMEVHFVGNAPTTNQQPPTANQQPTTFLRVSIRAFLRPEREFESWEALEAQIAADMAVFREMANAV